MLNYTETDIIHAPPERLWRFLSDVTRWPDYLDTVDAVEPLDAPQLAPGGRFRVLQPGLRPALWEVVLLDPPRQFTWAARSPGLVMLADHRIDGTGDGGSRLRLDYGFGGLMGWPLGLAFGSKTRRFMRREIEALKQLAEEEH